MSAALEPITRQRLEQFRRRWCVLEVAKGSAWSLIFGLLALVLVVGLDAAVVMPQSVRWLLSLVIYGSLGSLLLSTFWRVSRREPLPETARQFEELDPRLHEQLLSAVELSEDTPSNRLSSPGFRQRLQEQVARALIPVAVRDLLPWSLVSRGIVVALFAVGMSVGMAWIPGLHWPHRVARALLPGANLGRISRFHVEIVSPNPASTMLPRGDVAAIEARVDGPLPDKVQLETRIAGQTEIAAMRGITRFAQPAAASRPARKPGDHAEVTAVQVTSDDLVYTANVTLSDEVVEYRVIAEDAYTPWYRLSTRARPEVKQFNVTITPPAYTGLPVQDFQNAEGDLEALRGSRVRMQIDCDQPIASGRLVVNMADATEATSIELKAADEQQKSSLFAEFEIDKDFTYRVELAAADSGFTNAFSPEYQVRARFDESPRVTWISPETAMLVVEPNQLVPLTLHIEDELPVAEAVVFAGVAELEASNFKLDLPQQADLNVSAELDLLKIKPRLGDTVHVVVQVTDKAGQSTLSTPIDLVVTSTAIDPQRRPATEQRIELANELRKFNESVQPQIKRIRELNEEVFKTNDATERQARLAQFRTTASDMKISAKSNGKSLREKVIAQLKLPQDSVSLSELERTGIVLSRLEGELSQALDVALKSFDEFQASESSMDEKQRTAAEKKSINTLRSATEKISDASSLLDRRFREFVSHDVLSEVARGLSVVLDYQQQLMAIAEETSPAQLKRRQAIVSRQLRELEQVMIDRSPLLRDGASHGMRAWIEWCGQLAERIERVSADRDDNPNFKEFSRQVLVEVTQHQSVMSIDGGLAGELNNAHRELDSRSEPWDTPVVGLQTALSSFVVSDKTDVSASSPLMQALEQGLQSMQHRKELQQARSDSDAMFVSDIGMATRAVKQMFAAPEALTATQSKQYADLLMALKQLEAIHNVSEANRHLADLEQIERWNATSVDARTEVPRTWDALLQRMEQSSRRLREAGVDKQLVARLDKIRTGQSANEAGQKFNVRRWQAEARGSAERELTEMHGKLDEVRGELELVAQAARNVLKGLGPTIPQLAKQAAERTERLQQETNKLSEAAKADEVPDLKSRMNQLEMDQRRTAEPITDLRDALTEFAAVQNVLDEKERALARDADTSQHIIDRAAEQINESLKPAAAAESAKAAAEPLEKAAQAQGEAKEALEQIARHFQTLEGDNPDSQEMLATREALNELAEDMDMAAMDEWYKTAEMLSNLSGGDPQQVLKKLEEELNRNPRMREELSDLSKQAVTESVQALAYSADQERALQSQLEQSDPAYAIRKQLLQQDILAANERMQQWMQQLNNDARSVTNRAGATAQQQQLSQLQQQLEMAIADASAARDGVPLEDLQRIADAVVKSLNAATKEYETIAKSLEPAIQQPVHANEQELRIRKREMEDWERRSLQQLVRGAQSIERSHDQRARRADNDTRNSESLKRNMERHRDDLQKQVEANPNRPELAQALTESKRAIAKAERELNWSQQRQTLLKERLAEAKTKGQELSARKPTELTSANPIAELARRFTDSAAKTSGEIAEELKQALADTNWTSELSAAKGELETSRATQTNVERSVGVVASNLERASRHESRLERRNAAEQIAARAADVTHTKDQEVHQAKEQLDSAAELARAKESQESAEVAPPTASLAARGAVSAAETELRERVSELKSMLEKPPAEEPPKEAMPAPAQPSVPLDPKMLAQMLDELDRQMSSAPSNPQEEAGKEQGDQSQQAGQSQDDNNKSSSQQSSQSKKKSSSQTASMQNATRQLTEQMNRQRSQNRQSTASSRMTSNTADTKEAPPSAVRVLSVDRRTGADWGKLREQAAEETVESARQTIAPQYRQSVETYFRVLSERGHKQAPQEKR